VITPPKYTHDCEACKSLGQFEHEGAVHDLYWCGTHERGTVIARFGNDGPDYGSGLVFGERGVQPYKEALDRAISGGFYNPTKRPLHTIDAAQMRVAQAIGKVEGALVSPWLFRDEESELYAYLLQGRIDKCAADEEGRAEAAVYEAMMRYAEVSK